MSARRLDSNDFFLCIWLQTLRGVEYRCGTACFPCRTGHVFESHAQPTTTSSTKVFVQASRFSISTVVSITSQNTTRQIIEIRRTTFRYQVYRTPRNGLLGCRRSVIHARRRLAPSYRQPCRCQAETRFQTRKRQSYGRGGGSFNQTEGQG